MTLEYSGKTDLARSEQPPEASSELLGEHYSVLESIQPRCHDAENVQFPDLSSCLNPKEMSGALRVCIVTQDIVGPIQNGGIGTAYKYLAEELAAAGHQVTVLYALGTHSENGPVSRWVRHYAERGIRFVPLPEPAVPAARGPLGEAAGAAYAVYEWLKQQASEFDVVHASEWRGLAFYALQAKSLGLWFQELLFVIKTSSPTIWNHLGNAEPVGHPRTLAVSFMERRSVELADVVISGSAYMLRWMLSQGYRVDRRRLFVQPNVMPPHRSRPASGQREEVRELVFFGRLEPRKGLHLFCDAITRLCGRSDRSFSVTFLGKAERRFNSAEYIESMSEKWRVPTHILSDKGQSDALEYLAEPGRVAVIPSTLDNSPFGVYECLANGLSFIASDVGGIPELVHPDDRARVLFDLHPDSLCQRLESCLVNGAHSVRPSFDFSDNARCWARWHQGLVDKDFRRSLSPQVQASDAQPLVTVCVAHYNRPDLLQFALESIELQTYPNVEVVLVDDGSTDPGALVFLDALESRFAEHGWQLIRQSNKYLGAVRNTGARHAKGKYLLFVDDDNVAKPQEIATFVKVAEATGADVLTCFRDQFIGLGRPDPQEITVKITPIGADIAFGMLRNGFGDSNAFVRAEAFRDLGGFTEDYRVGKDDQEFFARAVLEGKRLEVVPEALYYYRINEVRMRTLHYNRYAGDFRVLRPYINGLPAAFQNLILFAQGQYLRNEDLLLRNNPGSRVLDSDRKLALDIVRSTSWRITRPLRMLGARFSGSPGLTESDVLTSTHPDLLVRDLQGSLSWEITGPVRVIGRLAKRLARRAS